MQHDKIRCTALTAAGKPCKGWAINGSIPPRCAPHSGLGGAPKGNTNAVTHGFYASNINKQEIASAFSEAEGVTLVQEAILLRVLLRRLTKFLNDDDLPLTQLTAVGPLIISASRALATINKQLPDPSIPDWSDTLDKLGEEWGWDL